MSHIRRFLTLGLVLFEDVLAIVSDAAVLASIRSSCKKIKERGEINIQIQ